MSDNIVLNQAAVYDALNSFLEELDHTYVGMKYVTTFSDPIDWSSENQYEQLTITRGTNGHYYVSRQFVPEGVLITDTDFWLDFFDIDESIEDYLENNDFIPANYITMSKLDAAIRLGYIRTFETVADMLAETNLSIGNICHTDGFYSSGDGGASYYEVSSNGNSNNMDVLSLQNNMYATLISDGNINVKQLGAIGDGETDDSGVMSHALNNYNNIIVLDTLAIDHVDCVGIRDKVINGFGVGGFVSITQNKKMFSNNANSNEDGIHNVAFENLSFTGSGYYNGLTWSANERDCGIDVLNSGNCIVRNCTFYNFGCIAVRITGGNLSNEGGNIFENNTITNNIEFSGDYSPLNYNGGIGTSGPNNIIKGNIITNCIQCIYAGKFVKGTITENKLTSVHQHCIYFGSGSKSVISNNIMDSSAGIVCVKLQHDANDSNPMENITISGNNIIGSGDQAILVTDLHSDASGVTINDIVINDNNITSSSRSIQCIKAKRVVISGNRCSSAVSCIYLSKVSDSIVNNCLLFSTDNSVLGYGINCDAVNYVKISNNIISNFRYAVNTGNSVDLKINDNLFKNIGTGVYSVTSATDLIVEINGNEFILDPVTFTPGTSVGFGTRIQAGKIVIARNNTFKEVGSNAVTTGLNYYNLTEAAYVIGNVSINNRYGLRMSTTMEALTSADANFWNNTLIN